MYSYLLIQYFLNLGRPIRLYDVLVDMTAKPLSSSAGPPTPFFKTLITRGTHIAAERWRCAIVLFKLNIDSSSSLYKSFWCWICFFYTRLCVLCFAFSSSISASQSQAPSLPIISLSHLSHTDPNQLASLTPKIYKATTAIVKVVCCNFLLLWWCGVWMLERVGGLRRGYWMRWFDGFLVGLEGWVGEGYDGVLQCKKPWHSGKCNA